MFKDKTNEELIKIAHNGDKQARDYLVVDNINLVYMVAHKCKKPKDDFQSLVNEGVIGLIKAIDNFDLDLTNKLSTYAVPMILGHITRFQRDLREDFPYKIKRSDYELFQKIQKATDELTLESTREEIAKHLGEDIKNIDRAITTHQPHYSFESCRCANSDGEVLFDEPIDYYNISERQLVNKIAIRQAISKLTKKQRKIINMRYFDDLSQMEISRKIGVGQPNISRLEKQSLNRLRVILREK